MSGPGQDVELRRHLVVQHDAERALEVQQELNAATLAVGDAVHAPARIDVQDVQDARAAGRVDPGARGEHLRDADVGGERERSSEKSQLAGQRGVLERRAPEHAHHVGRDLVPPGEQPKQRALSNPVGAEQQAASPGGEREGEVVQHGRGRAGVSEGQAPDFDGGCHGAQ